MEHNYQNIDQLFRENFSDHLLKSSEDHWDSVYRKVRRKRFFSADLSRFNILYSVFIISTFILSVAVFIDYLRNSNGTDEQVQVLNFSDTMTVKTVYIYDTIINYVSVNAISGGIEIDTASIIRNYLRSDQQAENPKKNLELARKTSSDTLYSEPEKDKRIIYRTVEKKDTVIKYIEKHDQSSDDENLFKRMRNNK